MTVLGLIFPPDHPPEELLPVARAADRAGLEQLWVWEDCFKESGIASAAAVLAATERITVGIGLLPVPLRNVALTAMEIATIERLFPGRLLPGVGHGILEWMGQAGARAASPMTLLAEYTDAVRRLLHGERLTTQGRYVRLTDVALDWPPAPPPPLLVGAVREKTVHLAGRLGDGVILTGETPPDSVPQAIATLRSGRDAAQRPPDQNQHVVAFIAVDAALDAPAVAHRLTEYTRTGVTHAIVLATGATDLGDYARFLVRDVRSLLD